MMWCLSDPLAPSSVTDSPGTRFPVQCPVLPTPPPPPFKAATMGALPWPVADGRCHHLLPSSCLCHEASLAAGEEHQGSRSPRKPVPYRAKALTFQASDSQAGLLESFPAVADHLLSPTELTPGHSSSLALSVLVSPTLTCCCVPGLPSTHTPCNCVLDSAFKSRVPHKPLTP